MKKSDKVYQITGDGGGIQKYLILVQLAVLVLAFTLVLERDDDETDEDIHHEEGDHDDERDEEDGDRLAIIVDRAAVLLV